MNVTEISLLPQDYARANYFKREIRHLLDYIAAHPAKADVLRTALADALAAAGGGEVVTLLPTQAIVSDSEVLTFSGVDYTFTVVDGEITDITHSEEEV